MDVALTLADNILDWVKLLEQCSDKLNQLADEMEETQKSVNVTKVIATSVAVASPDTGGAALPVKAVTARLASWSGLADSAGADVVSAVASGITMKEAEEAVKKIEDLHEEIDKVVEKLKEEAQKKGGYEGSCSDDQVTELILTAMAKRAGLMLDDRVSVKKLLEEQFPHTVKTPIWAALKESIQVTAAFKGQAVGGAARSSGGKTAATATGCMEGGGLRLVISIRELVHSPETEASVKLRETSRAIRAQCEEMKKHLQELEDAFQRLATVKGAIENKERTSAQMETVIIYLITMAFGCAAKAAYDWLQKPEAIFKFIDMFGDIIKLLKKKIKEEEKKNHSNSVDIIFVAHGAIRKSMIPAQTLCLPGITDVLLYSPWNCSLSARAAYGIATGRLKPQHRDFICRNKRNCRIPDAKHRPTRLPDKWNSMREAGGTEIPNIILWPLQVPEDGAWERIMFLENKYGRPGINRIVIPFIIEGNNDEAVPFLLVTLALYAALRFSRFEATLHLAACLSKCDDNMVLDEDALQQQYACTINHTRMTSSEDLSQHQLDELFRNLRAVFG